MKCFVIFLVLASFIGIVFAEETPQQPELTPICPEGTILKNNACIGGEPICGEGTTYQNGMCVVIKNKENQNSFDKWGQVLRNFVIESPLKQFKSGIPFNETQCKQNMILIQKYNGTPACVKLETKQKLIERGWGNKTITVQNSDFVISYSVTKGDLVSAMANLDTQSLILDVQMMDDSNMTIKLPRGLIDSINNGKDEVFTVLVEGKKVEHKEQNTPNHRILSFSLLSSETEIATVEIIPYCPSWKCEG